MGGASTHHSTPPFRWAALREPSARVLDCLLEGRTEIYYGEVELGFYPNAAPVTVAHIVKLFSMGCYDTNHVFRVDKGFVAQVQGVDGGRRAPMSKALRAVAKQTVPDEFSATLSHKRGMLSMGKERL